MNASYASFLYLCHLILFASAITQKFEQKCLQFKPESAAVEGFHLTNLEYLAANTTADIPNNDPSCNIRQQKVATSLCRVAGHVKTSEVSGVSLELWLPEQWTGLRLLSTGNGGVDGCIKFPDLAYGTAHGFATLGTNNGHDGASLRTLLNNDDAAVDFSHRALHTGTAAGRLLVEAFYGSKPMYSYYLGCSLGGRMGIQAADMYPVDYDGIVAGAPAVDFNLLQGQRAMFYNVTGAKGSANYIELDTWKGLIHDEVLRQCDGLDGVVDGIIEVPSGCVFRPEALLCADGSGHQAHSQCLNAEQVAQLHRIYEDFRWPNGSLLFPRMNPGNEIAATEKLLAGKPFNYSMEYYRYAITGDANWDMSRFNFETIRLGEAVNPGRIQTHPASLESFRERGGKMIAYHGGQDNQITSLKSELFWERLARHAGKELLDTYYRFFRISGMSHCSGGPGAWVFGQGGGGASDGMVGFGAETNVLAAIVAWVEDGQAPEHIRGTKFVNDAALQGVDFQRRHCRYPMTQTYVGGDSKQVSSWQCMEPRGYAWREVHLQKGSIIDGW